MSHREPTTSWASRITPICVPEGGASFHVVILHAYDPETVVRSLGNGDPWRERGAAIFAIHGERGTRTRTSGPERVGGFGMTVERIDAPGANEAITDAFGILPFGDDHVALAVAERPDGTLLYADLLVSGNAGGIRPGSLDEALEGIAGADGADPLASGAWEVADGWERAPRLRGTLAVLRGFPPTRPAVPQGAALASPAAHHGRSALPQQERTTMRLPTRLHGVLDYTVGALMIALPYLLGFAGGPAGWVFVGMGVATLLYSAFTDYELGLVKRLQMPYHLWLDALAGVLLAVSPWLFGFDTDVWIPHVAVGLFEIAAVVVTDTIPAYDRRRAG